MADRLSDLVLDMVDDALARTLALGEAVHCVEFQLAMMPSPQGMQMVGMLYVSLKGPVLGQTLGNTDLIPDLGFLSSQQFIDARVRACLEAIRAQKSQLLAVGNGHG